MNRLFLAFAVVMGASLPFNADALNGNGMYDYVTEVYACGPYVLIDTKSEGWVYIDPTDTARGMNATNTGYMLAIALQLLSSGREIGRWYEPTGVSQAIGCGMSATEITVLSATSNP